MASRAPRAPAKKKDQRGRGHMKLDPSAPFAPKRGRAVGTGLAALLAGASVMALASGAAQAETPAGTAAAAAAMAASPPASPTASVGEVIVTARKRKEAINKVPMSINAVSGAQIAAKGIERTTDLGRIVPGFTYTTSQVGTPIYTLRGVGFVDISMGGRPTVSVYSDQAPIPFTIETLGGNFDMERIEVLKGPQGTLYGQNSTGGAINLIAAKPTDTFQAGLQAGYGNYNAVTLEGYLSGPLTNTLEARLAVQHVGNDGWQKSYTTGETNGVTDLTSGRLIFDWRPTAKLKVELNLNGYIDHSDTPAAQLNEVLVPAAEASLVPALFNYPLAPQTDTAADWNAGESLRRQNSFFQAILRSDYELPHGLTLTSLTSFSHYDGNQPVDIDGTSVSVLQQLTLGSISSWYQELRLAGNFSDRGYFVLGANYASDKVRETNDVNDSGGTEAFSFVALGLPLFNTFRDIDNQDSHSYAVFGNVDYDLTRTVKLNAGVRYTRAIDKFNGCSADTGDGNAASVFGPFENFIRSLSGLPANPPIPPGGCVTANAEFVPQRVFSTLDQDNVSWRVGAQWQALTDTMLYVNVSKGYKAGGYPDLGATKTSQFNPATQESVLAYEAGFKARLFDRLQVNGAGFYYDYRDKQVLGTVADPVFGTVLQLLNIPKSRVVGAELQGIWTPIRGLTLSANGAYTNSKILGDFTGINALGVNQDFGGEPFPTSPTWQAAADVNYTWPLTDRFDGFVDADLTYKSATNNDLGEISLLAIKAYTLVDMNAGVQTTDGRWRVWAWVRNLGNTYYWQGAYIDHDVAVRYTGMPRTFGATLSYQFR
jgi:outer membrane receptor protein involved in Fe transport